MVTKTHPLRWVYLYRIFLRCFFLGLFKSYFVKNLENLDTPRLVQQSHKDKLKIDSPVGDSCCTRTAHSPLYCKTLSEHKQEANDRVYVHVYQYCTSLKAVLAGRVLALGWAVHSAIKKN